VHTDWEDPLYASDWTDSNGEYTLVVIAGAYTVVADQDGRVDTASTTVTVPPDRPGTDLAACRRGNRDRLSIDQYESSVDDNHGSSNPIHA